MTTHYSVLSTHYSLLTNHDSRLTTHDSLLTTHDSLLTTHYSLLTTHHALLTTHYPLHATRYSLLTTHYSLLTTHYSLLTTYDSLLNITNQCIQTRYINPPCSCRFLITQLPFYMHHSIHAPAPCHMPGPAGMREALTIISGSQQRHSPAPASRGCGGFLPCVLVCPSQTGGTRAAPTPQNSGIALSLRRAANLIFFKA